MQALVSQYEDTVWADIPEVTKIKCKILVSSRNLILFQRNSWTNPGDLPNQTQVSCTAGGFFTTWATREAYLDICVCVYTHTHTVAPLLKNPPAMHETPVQFLGQEVPLEKG